MQNFSLIKFIQNNEKIKKDTAPLIVKALLKPNAFSKKISELISAWYQNLSIDEKKYLYEIDIFKKTLSQTNPLFLQKIEISHLWVSDLFKNSNYTLSPNQIKKLSQIFQFTKITLPSNVEIYVNPEIFFKTLIQGINNHPHLIDEFKHFLNNTEKKIYITPENGNLAEEKFLGLFVAKTNSIYFQGDFVCYNALGTLIHEMGHVAHSKKIDCLIPESSLAVYYDEIIQEAKSTLIDTKEYDSKKGELNPFEDLYFYIEKKLKEKYPTLSKEKIDRATAFWFKNEIISISSLCKNQLINVLNIWHINKIRFTDQIFQHIEHLKKQYSNPSDITNSYRNAAKEVYNLFLKQVKKPFYFTKKMQQDIGSFTPFSENLISELSNYAGYIESNENLYNFMIKYCSIEIKNDCDLTLSFNLENFDEKTIFKTQNFYIKKGVLLAKKGKILSTKQPESIERMTRIIQHFFGTTFFSHEDIVYHFSNDKLSKSKKNQVINLLRQTKTPFFNIGKDIFIHKHNINYKNIANFSTKKLLVGIYPPLNTDINLVKIFRALSLNPKIYSQTDDGKVYLLFDQKEFSAYKKIRKLIEKSLEIHKYYYGLTSSFRTVFVPNRLLAKKNKLFNQSQKEKN